MLARLTSLRFWLLVAMTVAGVVGLGGAYLAFGKIQTAQERRADRHKAALQAAAVARQIAAGAGVHRLAALQAVLPNNQLIVLRGGKRVFAGSPIRGRELEVTASASFPGGRVIIREEVVRRRPPLFHPTPGRRASAVTNLAVVPAAE